LLKVMKGLTNYKKVQIQIWSRKNSHACVPLTLILPARAGNKLPNVYLFTEDQSKELKIRKKYVILAYFPFIILF
ncbi:MAG: hypothetical protein ACK559_35605, partial [bacterium]